MQRAWAQGAAPDIDVIVCDDGLQHLALARDVEICVFNDQGTATALPLQAAARTLASPGGPGGVPGPPMSPVTRQPLPCSAPGDYALRADGSQRPDRTALQPL